MSNAVTRLTILNTVRQRLDMVGSTFIADATFNQWIDDSSRDLYDLLVDARGEDYYTTSGAITTSAGTVDYPLANSIGTGFYKLRGLYLIGADEKRRSMDKVGLDEMVRYDASNNPSTDFWTSTTDPCGVVYCLFGNTIRFAPAPSGIKTVEIWYIPPFTAYSSDSSTIDAINGWHEYIVADVCIKGATVEEADVSVFAQQKQAQMERIGRLRHARDRYKLLTVRDVQNDGNWRYF
jgi:hypothetical protein